MKRRYLSLFFLLLALVGILKVWLDYKPGGRLYEWVRSVRENMDTERKVSLARRQLQETLEWHGMEIPGGIFLMGDHRKEGGEKESLPEQPVTLDAYLIGESNVTRWEWENVVRATQMIGYEYRNWKMSPVAAEDANSLEGLERLKAPMEKVSWYDALTWCNAKSELHGLSPCYYQKWKGRNWKVFHGSKDANVILSWDQTSNGYRLPTEAEWERAARGGLGRKLYPWGDDKPEANSIPANRFGLTGLLSKQGNWCWDKFAPYTALAKTNPMGPPTEGNTGDRVLRGKLENEEILPFVFKRNHSDEGNPIGGLRLAAGIESFFVSIPEGEFLMGDNYVEHPPDEDAARPARAPANGTRKTIEHEGGFEENPVHPVNLKEFKLSRTTVAFGEWKRVKEWAENNGYDFANPGQGKRDDYPVTHINWHDAVKWCNARSEMDGLDPCYFMGAQRNRASVYRRGTVQEITDEMLESKADGYRLPTEAEWEKAAKAGKTETRYPCGKQINQWQAVYVAEVEDANTREKNLIPHPVFKNGPAPVRTFCANGLYGMTGNVWEWCWDSYGPYPDYPSVSPPITENPEIRVLRGGSWKRKAWDCRSSRRGRSNAAEANDEIGFRIVKK